MRCSYVISLNLCVFKCVYRTADLVSWKHSLPFLAQLASSWSSCFVLESALSTIMPSESDTMICYRGGVIAGSASHLRYYRIKYFFRTFRESEDQDSHDIPEMTTRRNRQQRCFKLVVQPTWPNPISGLKAMLWKILLLHQCQ